MTALLAILFAAMTSADAIATLLNSPSAVSAKTYADARAQVEREAAEGKPLQQFVAGLTMEDKAQAGRYRDASRNRIIAMARERNNALAWYLLSMENNDLKFLQRAAELGNVQALNALGTIAISEVFNGRNLSTNRVDRILKRCYGCFSQAAAKRDANGFINLGACYTRGIGCKSDLALAFECYKSAAELGHPEGMDNLSACYQLGHGVKKNDELSLYWRMHARATRGDEAAAKWLKEQK